MSAHGAPALRFALRRKGRWRLPEILFWLVAAATLVLLRNATSC